VTAAAPKPLYDPSPFQQEFHLCPANEILIGGSAGPGKSLSLLMDPIITQLYSEHERWLRKEISSSIGWAIHFRREFPRLEQTIERSHRLFRTIDPGAKYDSQRHMWTFSCGYKFQFGHMKNLEDRFNYLSNEYTHIAWDELFEFEQEQYEYVNTRLRTADHVLQRKLRIVAATNPAGNWVRDYFVAPARQGRVLLTKKILLDDGTTESRARIFIPATLKDNPDPEFRRRYEIELQDKPAHIRQALLYGDWYVVPGAFFAEEWIPNVHVVKPFKIPSGWTRFRVMDWGYKSWCVVTWWAVDKDGDIICYRERNFKRKDAEEVAEAIRSIEMRGDEWSKDEWDRDKDCSRLSGPADNQIWEQRGTIGPSIAETMSEMGVWWEKCTKDRRAAVQQFLLRLKDRSGERPGISFFDTCEKTITTIPARETDPNDPELPADGGDDHWLDTVLYACMYRAQIPKSDEARRRYPRDELEERRSRKNVRRGGRYGYGGF